MGQHWSDEQEAEPLDERVEELVSSPWEQAKDEEERIAAAEAFLAELDEAEADAELIASAF